VLTTQKKFIVIKNQTGHIEIVRQMVIVMEDDTQAGIADTGGTDSTNCDKRRESTKTRHVEIVKQMVQ
jgi:hypothetical protein